LVDLGRPISNGFHLADELRAHCPTAKLVAITAFTAADIVPRTRDAGFEKVRFKPAPARVIKEAVDTQCGAASVEE
jgi:DNA-binding NarL/FixJ family response regulator